MSYLDIAAPVLKHEEDKYLTEAETARYVADLNYLARVRPGSGYRAQGGPVEKDRPYVVGEEGPEVIVPKQAGTVIPNKSLADLAPRSRAAETGTWEDVGGGLQATSGPGTYTRPKSSGGGLDALVGKGPGKIEMQGGVPTGRILAPGAQEAMESGQWVGQPVHVIRGLRSSYAGGPAGREFSSWARAARAARGENVGPELMELAHQQKLEEIAAGGKALEAQGGLAARSQESATKYLTQMLLQEHGMEEKDNKGQPTGQRVLSPYAQNLMLNVLPQVKTMEDVPRILGQIKPQLEAGKQIALMDTEGSRARMLANYRLHQRSQGLASDPAQEQIFLRSKITPENYRAFQGWLNYGGAQPAAAAPALQKAARAAAPSIRQQRLAAEREADERSIIAPGHEASIDLSDIDRAWRKNQAEKERRERALDEAFARNQGRIAARQEGGPVEKDRPYVVGEEGPEVFAPETGRAPLPDMNRALSDLSPVRETKIDEVALAGKG